MSENSGRKWAFLSNGLTSAIESAGSIDWFPCPTFDSMSIFSKLLDDKSGGSFCIRPESKAYKLDTKYLGDTLVIQNKFTGADGRLEVEDALPIGLPAIVRKYDSTITFVAEINPVFRYGMINPSIEYLENGLIFRNTSAQEGFEVLINGKYKILERGILRFEPGKGTIFALYSKDLRYGLFSNKSFVYPTPEEALEKTASYWSDQIKIGKEIKSYKEAYKRSVMVVLGLIYQPSG
ncbi:MAG: trehalase-like domain-containing protein, partial [Candidatus Micrarchaeaceae archaeon]